MTSTIDQAIEAAKQQALGVQTGAMSSSLPTVAQRGTRLTMADLDSSSLDVTTWLQCDKYGLHIDKSSEALDEIIAEIDLDEVIAARGVRFGKNPAQYRKSYDGVSTFGSPKPWMVTLQEACQYDPDCKGDYAMAEIPFTLINDVELKRDKKTIAADTRVGYSTPVTGYRPFRKFWDACQKANMTGVVKVKITWEKAVRNGNEWGIVHWNLLQQ